MSEKIIRRLSVIMFTEIVDNTAMMRAGEMSGFSKVKRYRKELDRLVNEHHGEILQHSEDGSLTTFTSAVEAIRCAYHLQLALKPQATGEEIIAEIPLRIGLHIGEIIIDGSDIYGNGIHVASRIGSLGQPGTVLFSHSIYEKISTYPEFKITALGAFQLKNVKGPFEVFALIKEGLTVPEYSQEVQSGQIGTKRKRWTRAMQMFAGYLVGAWTIVQFVDWILNRYQISPYWTDILLLLFVGVVPSLLIYLVNQDRIHERILLQREKIIIPLNIFLLLGAITFAYGGTDLGSINKNISFDDINGNAINQEIVKNEFRTSLLIFPFTQQKGADTTHWIGNALSTCLMTDVTQDKYLNIHYHLVRPPINRTIYR